MNILKATTHSARLVQRRGLANIKSQLSNTSVRSARPYSTNHVAVKQESSNTPWVIGSLIVFGPLLFKLTSPPPSKKKATATEHVASTDAPVAPVEEEEEEEEESVVAPVKKVQKPYVLVGAGTASFAAAQAIREKDPEANVNHSNRLLFYLNCVINYYLC